MTAEELRITLIVIKWIAIAIVGVIVTYIPMKGIDND